MGFGTSAPPVRIVASPGWAAAGLVGPAWQVSEDRNAGGWQDGDYSNADCWLVAGADVATADFDTVQNSGLPLVLAPGDCDVPAAWIDLADGFILPGDDATTVAAVLARAAAPAAIPGVSDLSDGVARTINALSAEASRIAEQLARLAEAQRVDPAPTTIDAKLVRRILKLRRDRERYFPAEIFADPAWDMLLDLTAARLEDKRVPVSSLCIAAAVPTTTALRWIRSLTEAGIFERYTDPADARRSHVEIADPASAAMFAYLRAFGLVFGVR